MSKDSLGKILKTGKEIDPSELKKKLKSAIFSQPLCRLEGKTTAFSPFQYDWVANTDENSFSNLENVINVDVIELTLKKKKKKQKSKVSKFNSMEERDLNEKTIEVKIKKELKTAEPIENLTPKELILDKTGVLPEVNWPIIELKTEDKNAKPLLKTKKSTKSIKLKVEKEAESEKKDKTEKKAKKNTFKKKKVEKTNNKQDVKQDSFTSWLNSLKNREATVDQEFTVKSAIAKPLKKAKKASKFSNKKKVKSEKKLNTKKKALKQKISTSIMSKEDIATKTLAQLYAEQGYNKKAITIYERLSLKNPEKSSFFADQIEKLKKEI